MFAVYNHLETDKNLKVYRYLDMSTSRLFKQRSLPSYKKHLTI
ncbi:hypothetical protein ACEQPO_01900 [Bacillus sp. SL00103]